MVAQTKKLISMVESLPLDIKTVLVEKILNSIHPSQKEIDALWAKEAEKRMREIGRGKVKTIPGNRVFKEIFEIYKSEIFIPSRSKKRVS